MLQSPDPGIWLMLIIKAIAWNSKQHWKETSGMSASFQITQRCDYTTIDMSFHITLSPLWLKGRLSAQRLSVPLFSSCRHLGHQRQLFLTLAERQKQPSDWISSYLQTDVSWIRVWGMEMKVIYENVITGWLLKGCGSGGRVGRCYRCLDIRLNNSSTQCNLRFNRDEQNQSFFWPLKDLQMCTPVIEWVFSRYIHHSFFITVLVTDSKTKDHFSLPSIWKPTQNVRGKLCLFLRDCQKTNFRADCIAANHQHASGPTKE